MFKVAQCTVLQNVINSKYAALTRTQSPELMLKDSLPCTQMACSPIGLME